MDTYVLILILHSKKKDFSTKKIKERRSYSYIVFDHSTLLFFFTT